MKIINARSLSCSIMVALVISTFFIPNIAAATVSIRVGHVNTAGDPSYDAWEYFKKVIEEKSNGEFNVKLFPAGQLGNERELIEQVKMGSIDICSVNVAPLCQTYSKFNIFVLPYIFRDEQHMFAFSDGPVGQDLARDFEKVTNIKLLAYWDNGVRHTFQSDKPVSTPDDLKGVKIRVMKNDVYLNFFGALGAMPAPMAFGEVYMALQTGVVEAADNDTSGYLSMKFYEPAKFFSLTGHVTSSKPVLASQAFMSKIPDDLKDLFIEVMEETKNWQRRTYLQKAAEDIAWMKKYGVKVNEISDRTAFQAIAKKSVWKKYEEIIGKDLIDSVINTK